MGRNTEDWPTMWQQLAVMISSGMPADRALKVLAKGTEDVGVETRLQRCIGLVSRGAGLAESFRRCKIVGEFDFELLKSAETAGSPEAGLQHISERRLNQLQQISSLKVSLILPICVLLIGAFAGIFVRVTVGNEPWLIAMVSVAFALTVVLTLTHLGLRALRSDSRQWLSLLWPLEFVKSASVRFQMTVDQLFFRSFIWQIKSGINAQEACTLCKNLLSSDSFHAAVAAASQDMKTGKSIPSSLIDNGLALSQSMRQVLLIADHSGQYDKAVSHHLALQYEELDRQTNETYKWLPKIYYVIVIAVIGGWFMG